MKHVGDIKNFIPLWIFISMFAVLPITASGGVPQQVDCQGFITDTSGTPIDGNYQMVFSIYDVSTGGTALWSEEQTILVINGIYNVQIGQDPVGNPFPSDLFDGQRWLGVTAESDTEMTPRQILTSTPFAMRAEVAETLIDDAVSTVHISDSAVTGDKVADDAVTGAKIADGTVTTSMPIMPVSAGATPTRPAAYIPASAGATPTRPAALVPASAGGITTRPAVYVLLLVAAKTAVFPVMATGERVDIFRIINRRF
jgi:hypothetical protein